MGTAVVDEATRERLRLTAAGMRILQYAGLDSGVAGASVDPGRRRGCLLDQFMGILWDEVGPDDFVRMSFDLEKIGGWRDLPSFGSGFHAAIYCRRPDVKVICHTHAPYLIALAAKSEPLSMYDQRSPMFLGRMGVFEQRTQARADGSLFFGASEAEGMADALGAYNTSLLLANHGAVTVGRDLSTTVIRQLFPGGVRAHASLGDDAERTSDATRCRVGVSMRERGERATRPVHLGRPAPTAAAHRPGSVRGCGRVTARNRP